MTFETLPDGRKALRVEIRCGEDGWTRAAFQLEPGGPWTVLAMVLAVPFSTNAQIAEKFIDLTRAVVTEALSQAGVDVTDAKCVEPGAPMHMAKH